MPQLQARVSAASQPIERRRQIRQVALLRVALLHTGGVSDICVVKNISPNGLSAKIYRRLTPGDEVQIEFRSGDLLAGTVVWEQESEIGLVFPKPIDVAAVLASRWTTETNKRRALPRIAVDCPAELSSGFKPVKATLRDISQGGASLEPDVPLADRSKVRLALPDLPPIEGVVRWTSDGRIGISFNECIAFDQLASWIQARREGLGRAALSHRPFSISDGSLSGA